MREPATATTAPIRPEHRPLPDFCSGPVIFALLITASITVTVMWLAPNNSHGWRGYTVGMLFADWLAVVIGVALCKLRPLFVRLPGNASYAGVWLAMVWIVAGGSLLVYWMDGVMQMELLRDTAGTFVVNNTMIAALLGAAMLRYFYLLAQWQTRLEAVSQAQVAALQARIRPHFLFNSMNTVAALVRVDPAAAERTVEDLSELFRAALGEHSTHDGTLAEELGLVDRYLDIEQLRLGERLRVRRELDDLPAGFPLPRLLLQPLVENAVRHGIQPLREGGEVILRGRRERDGVRIEIDNPLANVPTPGGHGHGLDNVRRRVAYRYGPGARVTAGPDAGRFVVCLQLPTQ
ncbi:sensor histidine kinase [Dyella japonica]|uniref:Histidine kinase n=1 Tax=Dyella japonica A8 TaxID=1217721 RepID=A0A075JWY1_9GAMM|nr:histidine kinase [Dyella japonica]AIF46414.1 histidine kinase [Dyella japonica A8]